MSHHHDPVVRPVPRWLVRSIAFAAWTIMTVASVAVAVALGRPAGATGGDLSAQPEESEPAGLARSAASSPVPPAEPPTVRGMGRSAPSEVSIPALGIQSSLVRLGLDRASGALQVPRDYATAGWYADGPYPGQANGPPAVIVGHVDSLTGPAVFFRLREIEPDTAIHVVRADGTTAVFRVVEARQYPKAALPAAELYARRQAAELVLITCTGDFDEATGSYLDNFVVTARLDLEASGIPA